MRAVDTNVVVRYLTGDHPKQAARAKGVIDAGHVFVSTTVMLETEWVLRSVYGFAGKEVAAALRAFAGLSDVSVENPVLLAEALDRVDKGHGLRGCAAPGLRHTMRRHADVRQAVHRNCQGCTRQGSGALKSMVGKRGISMATGCDASGRHGESR